MKRTLLSILLTSSLLAPTAPAAELCEELQAEYVAAQKAWRDRYRAATNATERSELRKARPANAYYGRYQALAEGGAECAYLWLIEHVKLGPYEHDERVAAAVGHYERLFVAGHDGGTIREGAELLLKDTHLIKERGFAEVERLARLAREAAPQEAAEIELALARKLADSKSPADAKRGLELVRAWLEKNPEHPAAERAREKLYRVENLSVGALAPDFTGQTVDGESVRLADHRGQVVVLDFFGFWCKPCVAELPHLRKLVERHADSPFALIGIDTNDTESVFRKGSARHDVSWPCVFQGTEFAVTRQYRVTAFPTTFVIDHEGRIQAIGLRGRQLDRVVDRLVSEAAAAQRGGGEAGGSR